MRMRSCALICAALVAAGCASTPEGEIEEDRAGLLARATVTPDSARALARAHLPGWQIDDAEIREEDGRLWYEIEMERDATETDLRVDANTGRIFVPATAEEEDGLMERAGIPDERAREIALGRVADGRIIEAELEIENGILVYSYEIVDPTREGITEIDVDAANGNIVAEEQESTD